MNIMGRTIIGAASGEFVQTTPKDSQSQATGQKTYHKKYICVIVTEIEELSSIFFIRLIFNEVKGRCKSVR